MSSEAPCLFCQIIAGELPANVVYQDDRVIAFTDVNPQAPTHVLVVPREHLESLNDVSQSDETLLGHMGRTAARVANQFGIAEQGYRTVINTGTESGQSVPHLHLHVLGGRPMAWPPG